MITSIQTIMDDVATVAEQVLGVLTWREPRVTFVATCALMSASVGYFFSLVVFDVVVAAARLYASNAAEKTNRAATSVVGKVVETVTERANAVWERYFEHAYATLEHAVVSSTRETVGALLRLDFFTLEAVFARSGSRWRVCSTRSAPGVFGRVRGVQNAAKGGGPGVDEASEADRKEVQCERREGRVKRTRWRRRGGGNRRRPGAPAEEEQGGLETEAEHGDGGRARGEEGGAAEGEGGGGGGEEGEGCGREHDRPQARRAR